MSETSLNLCEGGSVIRVSIPGIHHYLINVRRAAIRRIHSVASLYVLHDVIDRLLGEKEEEERGKKRRRRGGRGGGEGGRGGGGGEGEEEEEEERGKKRRRRGGKEKEGEGKQEEKRRRDLNSSVERSRAVKLTMRGYGTLPYEYISHNSIPKLHTSDLLENFYTHTKRIK